MHPIRRFDRPFDAWAAAGYLWRHGIVASVFVPQPDALVMNPSRGSGRFRLYISDRALEAEALTLLAEMEAEPAEFATDWEDREARPDLSVLDASLVVGCPACGATLPLDASVEACPVCAQAVDIGELLVGAHGPEVLEPCYPEPAPLLPEEAIDNAAVPCPHCQHILEGVGREGACPNCGNWFRKQEFIRQWFG